MTPLTTFLTTTQPILSGTRRYLNYRLGATDFLQTSTLRHNTTRSGRCSLRTSNPPVAGSNPAGRALKNRVLAGKTQYKKWGSRYHWKCFIPTLHQPGLIRDLEPVPCEGLGCWDARGVGNGKTLPGYGRVARASTFRGSRGKGGDVFGAVADK
jgi:hypothetical protein